MANPNLPISGNYNTYIGARYVPVFANPIEWNNAAQYEPLTIVTYQGNSYTSRTFVPVGVDILNETYWAPTGNYNAQVEQYRQDVNNLQNNYNSISSSIFNNQIKLVFPKVVQDTDPEGSCGFLVLQDGHGIIFDLSQPSNFTEISNALSKHGVTQFDYIFISHWDTDHASNPDLWKSYITTNTRIYAPYSTTKSEEATTNYNAWINAYPSSNFVFPSESNTLETPLFKFQFFNCGESVRDYWDTQNANYNDYSMVVYLWYGETCICFPGDIQYDAETRLYNNGYYHNAQLITAPHHTVQGGGNRDLAISIGSQYVYANDSQNVQSWFGYRDVFISALGPGGAKIYRNSTSQTDVIFTITQGGIIPPTGVPQSLRGGNQANIIYLTVDYSKAQGYQDGTANHPFAKIESLIGNTSSDYNYVINVNSLNTGENVTLTGLQGLEIIINTNTTINQITLNNCSGVTIRGTTNAGATITTVTLNGSSSVYFYNINIGGLTANRSFIQCLGVTFTGSNPTPFVVDFCVALIRSCVFSGTGAYAISNSNSVISMSFAFNNFNNFTSIAKVTNGGIINNISAAEFGIKKYLTSDSTAINLFWDTNNNNFCIVRNGTVYDVTTTARS